MPPVTNGTIEMSNRAELSQDVSALIGRALHDEAGRIHSLPQSFFWCRVFNGTLAFGKPVEVGAIAFYTSISMEPSVTNIS